MTGGFIWYELMTPDPEGAKTFYDAVVGWSLSTGHGGDSDYGFITRRDGGMNGGVLRLSPDMAAHGARPCWLGYLHVADVDATAAAIAGDGGRVLMPARDVDMAGRFAMVADPQGAPFYIMTPTPPPDRPDAVSDAFSVTEAQHVRWNELSATDPDAAIAFYRRHFGWDQEGAMEMGDMGAYCFLQHGGVGIGAVMPMIAETPAPGWHYYIGVDDIDRAVAAVRAGGGTLMHEPMAIPGGEFAVSGTDPQGAAFGLVGPRND